MTIKIFLLFANKNIKNIDDYKLVNFLIFREPKILERIINFIGEDEFIENYFSLEYPENGYLKIFKNLVKLEKYDLLVKIIQIYIDANHKNKGKMLNKILQNINKSIESKDKQNIIKYLKYLSL